MGASANRETVERFWRAMSRNDWRAAARLLHAECVVEWPQSGERLRGPDRFAEVNARYPAAGPWRFTVHRLVADEHGVATDVGVTDGALSARAVSFFEVRDGSIRRIVEFWPEPFPPAGWRSALVERIVSVAGGAGRLRVSDGGAGEPAVVFLHGLGSDLEAWRAQLDHLRPGRRAVAYDQRGHGGSEGARDGTYTVEALADDLDAVVRALGLRRVVLVGHSLSGTVVTAWAGAHPEAVVGLVYVDAVGDFAGVPRQAVEERVRLDRSIADAAARRAAFAEMLGAAARPATREHVLRAAAILDDPAFPALRRSMFEFRVGGRLAGCRAPVLAIEAEGADQPIMASRVLRQATRVTVPGVSHWLMMDDPEAFDRALDAFLVALPQG